MHRREFLAALPCATGLAQTAVNSPESLNAFAEIVFLEIARGYVANLAKTSDSFACVEFPGATVTKSFLTKSGKSVTGVSRMMPALAAWIVGKRQPSVLSLEGAKYDLLDVLGSGLTNGTNPSHKDYWQDAPADKPDQRQVEASMIAWSLWLLRDTLLPQMSSEERRRIDAWLRSCTVVPVRRNNWAWFTAVNHAARMVLKDKFDEFSYDQNAMFDDLRALDAMYSGSDGWYNDDKPHASFDYYNSWVFASHFLYWNAMVGSRFPDWSRVFADRLRLYLDSTPMFFGANGSHVLYGRSLIYRWAVLTPLVLAYWQKLWPHDDATLHRIVRGNLDFHWKNGAFDPSKGRLRETWSEAGTPDVRESYIDGGHPYWAMQAFALWLIPRPDSFWGATGGTLPVERGDFRRQLDGPGILLNGVKASGHVKLIQGRSTRSDVQYRDKYVKFVYSSHFPFDIVQKADVTPWDNALVLREPRTHKSVGRGEITDSRVLPDGVEIAYPIEYERVKLAVRSTILVSGDFELRIHRVIAPAQIEGSLELAEGSCALGLANQSEADPLEADTSSLVRHRKTGALIGSWTGAGWAGVGAAWDFGSGESAGSNVLASEMLVNTLWAALRPGVQLLFSVHYASPRPLPIAQLHAGAARLLARGRTLAGGGVAGAKQIPERRR